MSNPVVSIIMGSQSDLRIMKEAAEVLDELGVPYALTVVSAHRTPLRMVEFAQQARSKGVKVIIAGAGGAAHLPGMVASLTSLPVIGVPVKSSNSIDGWDSVLSILQMPAGVPVATVALDGARNAGILAAQIIGASDPALASRLDSFKESLKVKVQEAAVQLETKGWREFMK
jgi:5-(carboxyamino)imidazole ribonucleotide mutase